MHWSENLPADSPMFVLVFLLCLAPAFMDTCCNPLINKPSPAKQADHWQKLQDQLVVACANEQILAQPQWSVLLTITTLCCTRVLERYPNNGKLLKIYGRFLEYVRNDPWTAAKYYAEASKYGTSESLLTLAQGQNTTVAGGSNNLASATGTVNERVDGLMIINSSSQIMMVNAAALALFGYGKGELEGKGLPMLM